MIDTVLSQWPFGEDKSPRNPAKECLTEGFYDTALNEASIV